MPDYAACESLETRERALEQRGSLTLRVEWLEWLGNLEWMILNPKKGLFHYSTHVLWYVVDVRACDWEV